MKVKWNSKYTTISVYALITFTLGLIIYRLMNNISGANSVLKNVVKVLSPMIWGVCIAYILTPVMLSLERISSKLTGRKKPHPKLDRVIATILSMLFFIVIIAGLFAIIIPNVIDSIMGIFNNFGTYMTNLENWVDKLLNNYPEISNILNSKFEEITLTLEKYVNDLIPKLGDLVVKVKDGALSFVGAIKDFLIGVIAAVYFLLDKEHFQAQLKKIIKALFPEKFASEFLRICTKANVSFSGFISGKLADSLIIGLLCFICMSIMHFDYVLLISVIVGATNIIPFFGPFFGAIPSALLLLLSSPHQVLPFILLIVVIQQLDGNVIGPKILGNSTGLSAFWVMFAIIVGGGLFGFPGMVIGVPVFAVVYSIMDEFVCYTLRRKGLSDLTSDYAPIPAIHDEKKSTDLTPKKSFRLWRPNKNTHDDKNETPGNDDENDAGVE